MTISQRREADRIRQRRRRERLRARQAPPVAAVDAAIVESLAYLLARDGVTPDAPQALLASRLSLADMLAGAHAVLVSKGHARRPAARAIAARLKPRARHVEGVGPLRLGPEMPTPLADAFRARDASR